MRRKLFVIGFCIMFISTALICILTKQPLIFFPVNYGIGAFLEFALLVGILCFLLVFISLPLLRFLKNLIKANLKDEAFYLIGSITILQIATLLIGYTESAMTRGANADFFYYYKGASNSHIYIFTGNLTSAIVASLYSKVLNKKKQEEKETKLELRKE